MKIIGHLKHVKKNEVTHNLITEKLLQSGPPRDAPRRSQGHALCLGQNINNASWRCAVRHH